jgi:hypothetical protein
MIYLATPYSKYPYGKEQAFREACEKAWWLMQDGKEVFCPIAHSHSIESFFWREGEDFWLKQDFAVLSKCDKVLVYMMPGWEESSGVTAEIAKAKELGIPIEYEEYVCLDSMKN